MNSISPSKSNITFLSFIITQLISSITLTMCNSAAWVKFRGVQVLKELQLTLLSYQEGRAKQNRAFKVRRVFTSYLTGGSIHRPGEQLLAKCSVNNNLLVARFHLQFISRTPQKPLTQQKNNPCCTSERQDALKCCSFHRGPVFAYFN